jgi:hypothetical protein
MAKRMPFKKLFVIETIDDLLSYCTLDPKTGCLVWSGGKDWDGYGAFLFQGKQWRTNRLAWLLSKGEYPGKLKVCHTCDNPPCCNPEHLWLGTIKQNSHDMVAKGRAPRCGPRNPARGERHGSRTRPERVPRGERSGRVTHPERTARGERGGNAIKSTAEVLEIRRRYAAGEGQRSIAAAFGISRSHVSNLVRKGGAWAHLPYPQTTAR